MRWYSCHGRSGVPWQEVGKSAVYAKCFKIWVEGKVFCGGMLVWLILIKV
ncbi:MAG: hypothetical protein ACFE9Z_04800 [Promethearchaeota archaeon]